MVHIENQLAEQPDLADGDRRALLEQLRALAEDPDTGDVETRQAGALERLRQVAPRAWEAAWPSILAIATAEIKRQLGLPTG